LCLSYIQPEPLGFIKYHIVKCIKAEGSKFVVVDYLSKIDRPCSSWKGGMGRVLLNRVLKNHAEPSCRVILCVASPKGSPFTQSAEEHETVVDWYKRMGFDTMDKEGGMYKSLRNIMGKRPNLCSQDAKDFAALIAPGGPLESSLPFDSLNVDGEAPGIVWYEKTDRLRIDETWVQLLCPLLEGQAMAPCSLEPKKRASGGRQRGSSAGGRLRTGVCFSVKCDPSPRWLHVHGKVEVEWGGDWWEAIIIRVETGSSRVKIHYVGGEDSEVRVALPKPFLFSSSAWFEIATGCGYYSINRPFFNQLGAHAHSGSY
jgi:hypothetical protein